MLMILGFVNDMPDTELIYKFSVYFLEMVSYKRKIFDMHLLKLSMKLSRWP